jgi:hypothetical protein
MMTVVDIMTVLKKKAGNSLKLFCHDQVKILLERMDSHPEEFTSKEKWDLFLPFTQDSTTLSALRKHNLYKYFTKVERIAIGYKLKSIVYEKMRQEAYNGIMETLVKSDYKDMDDMFGKSSITYTSAKYSVEQMIKQIEALAK